jgi:hypothetical protein
MTTQFNKHSQDRRVNPGGPKREKEKREIPEAILPALKAHSPAERT